MKLVIANKNYSSWSFRPWLLLTETGLVFEEVNESLNGDDLKERLGRYSPSCKVPVLIDGELTVWDSLAICEYVSEKYLAGKGWPLDEAARARARSISAEMHSSFQALRSEMPMNIRAKRTIEPSEAARNDIRRIDAIWTECRQEYGNTGKWLFGGFSIADCMFAPVVMRFLTYGADLSGLSQQYMTDLLSNNSVKAWVGAAKEETETIPGDEAGA
ncbi:glutathione S-transferase family protein [bacterium]|nr:glutathione S-transferase family protein [bacterium]